MVICDYKTFDSMEEAFLLDGVAEAIKSGMIMESSLIDRVLAKDYGKVIERCVSIKKSVVEADERDIGMRQLLNFGHTIGHGIETEFLQNIPRQSSRHGNGGRIKSSF